MAFDEMTIDKLPHPVVHSLRAIIDQVWIDRCRRSCNVYLGDDLYECYAYPVAGYQISYGVNGPPHGWNILRGLMIGGNTI